jgi:hypothetical protein
VQARGTAKKINKGSGQGHTDCVTVQEKRKHTFTQELSGCPFAKLPPFKLNCPCTAVGTAVQRLQNKRKTREKKRKEEHTSAENKTERKQLRVNKKKERRRRRRKHKQSRHERKEK